MDCVVHGVTKSQTPLSHFHFHPCSWVTLVVKNPAANARDAVSIPGLGRSLRGGNATLQFSCLGNPMNREPGGLQLMRSQRVRHD